MKDLPGNSYPKEEPIPEIVDIVPTAPKQDLGTTISNIGAGIMSVGCLLCLLPFVVIFGIATIALIQRLVSHVFNSLL